MAGLLDVLIIGVIGYIIGTLLGSFAGGDTASVKVGISTNNPGEYALSLVMSILYYVGLQGYMGQTLGKKVMGIRVVDEKGQKPSYFTFFLREIIGKFVSAIILLIGYFMILWDSKKQGLHDKIASTYVVKV